MDLSHFRWVNHRIHEVSIRGDVKLRRRDFLLGTSAIAVSAALAGCQSSAAFTVELLQNSVPPQMLRQFRRNLAREITLNFVPQPQLKDLFELLRKGQLTRLTPTAQPASAKADLVMLGDYWLAKAIQQELIQPLQPQFWEQWGQLPQKWQNLVKRNAQGQLDANGDVWAAPYRWGTTVMIYRKDKFKTLGWTPEDWQDLWRDQLRDRISLLNQPREVIGLTLKKLGQSYNTTDLNSVEDLPSQLQQLHQNVKLYDSNTYLKPLIIGDTWLAVGWSTDIPTQVQRQHNLGVVVPASGTALWTDLWVKPVSASQPTEADTADQWIDFCWQPEIAQQLSLLTEATSPIVPGLSPEQLLPEWNNHSILLPNQSILDNSEFLLPLPEDTLEQYRQLWQKIRLS
jgi:putative spermidine/putrescine transport system substrate-binding protein